MKNLNECFSKILKKNHLVNGEDALILDNFIKNKNLINSVEGLLWLEKIFKNNNLIDEKHDLKLRNLIMDYNGEPIVVDDISSVIWIINILKSNNLLDDVNLKEIPSPDEKGYYVVADKLDYYSRYTPSFIKIGTKNELDDWISSNRVPKSIIAGPFVDEIDAIKVLWSDKLS